jgi:ferredoxin-fold anticodon binding domain-containing protein
MSELLRGLVGSQVRVYSIQGQSEASDTGLLEAFDDNWVCLNQDGERLYFSVHRIRLIKPV